MREAKMFLLEQKKRLSESDVLCCLEGYAIHTPERETSTVQSYALRIYYLFINKYTSLQNKVGNEYYKVVFCLALRTTLMRCNLES